MDTSSVSGSGQKGFTVRALAPRGVPRTTDRRPIRQDQDVEIWFNPACTKCRIAQEMLDEAGADYVVRRYLEAPPTATEIDDVLKRLDLQPWDITRMGEPLAAELGLADRQRDRTDWIALLAANLSLIQRPIILTADGSAWVARSPEEVEKAVAADQR